MRYTQLPLPYNRDAQQRNRAPPMKMMMTKNRMKMMQTRADAAVVPAGGYTLRAADRQQAFVNQVKAAESQASAPKGIDVRAALLNLFFEPLEAPFRACCVTGACAGCLAFETVDLTDMQCACCGGTCSAFAGRWSFSRIWKGTLLFVSFFLYVFALVWIVAIYQGIQTCDLGGVQLHATMDVLTGLFTTALKGGNVTATSGMECNPTACQFTMAGSTVNLETYVNFRLSIYLISAAPVLYLMCMLVMHMQQASNEMMTALYPMEQQPKTTPIDPNNIGELLYNAQMAFDPQNWHLFWLNMLVLLNLLFGVCAMALDISLAQWLASNWSPTSACYLVEHNMVHYQPGVRLSIQSLPIALCVPCVVYTIWCVMFLVNSVMNLFRRKLDRRGLLAETVVESIPAAMLPSAIVAPAALVAVPA